jgi:CDP-diacylglycerol--serine O-phosphatidyltransferase
MSRIEGRFIIPNIVTGINMFFGFLSIVMASKGDFEKAGLFILLAIISDGADGKIARMLNGFSDFGKEFDSFSDAISFGIAPSILIYSILKDTNAMKELIVPVSFLFLLCAILRLVKFNITTIPSKEKADFIGMPTPTAAGIISSYVVFMYKVFGEIRYINIFLVLSVLCPMMMISTVRFKSILKTFKLKNIWVISILGIPLFLFFQYTFLPFGLTYSIINIFIYAKSKKIKLIDDDINN